MVGIDECGMGCTRERGGGRGTESCCNQSCFRDAALPSRALTVRGQWPHVHGVGSSYSTELADANQ